MRSFEASIFALAVLAASTALAKPILQIRDPPSGIISFDFAVHLNLSLGGSTIADLDRARAAAKLSGLSRRDGTIGSTNTGVTYVVDVGVGEPATTYSLIVDTGSSNTWIGKTISWAAFIRLLTPSFFALQVPVKATSRRVLA